MGHTWVLGSKFLNEFRFNYAQQWQYQAPEGLPYYKTFDFSSARFNGATPTYIFPSFTWGSDTFAAIHLMMREWRDDFTMLSESLKGVIAQTLCKKIGGGRAAALEVLIVTGAVSNLIREAKTFQIPSIMQVGKSVGMVSLNDALMDLVAKKLVAPEEAYAKSVDRAGFEAVLKRARIDTKFATAAKEN